MRILVILYRDIHETDAGGSRTVILVNNYLAAQPGVKVYASYRHLSPVDPRIEEIPLGEHTPEKVRALLVEKGIDILLVPEGERYASLAREAVRGTACKVVTEFHNKPGYEVLGLKASVRQERRQGGTFRKGLATFKLLFFPFYRYLYRRRSRSRFRDAYELADRLVVLSPAFIREYEKAYRLSGSDRMRAIGNALSFRRELAPEELSRKEKTVLVVSRLDEVQKRLSYALKAWAVLQSRYPGWDLKIVGSGESEDLYRKMARRLKLERISFEGRRDPEAYYTRASVFWMTSAYEGWGMTLTEALQKGCVPVAMDSYSALRDLLTDGEDGFVTPDRDLDAFIDRSARLMAYPAEREAMARRGLRSCRRFAMERIGPQWTALFEEVVNEG